MKKYMFTSLITAAGLSFNAFAAEELSILTSMNPSEASYQSFLEQIDVFESLFPDVKIKISSVGHDNYFTKLQALTLANELPDLVHLWPSKRTAFATESGKIMDLRPFIERDNLHETALPVVLEPQGENGELYIIPNNVNITSLVYTNVEILKELGLDYPETLEEWYKQVDVIRDAGYYPLVFGNASSWVAQSCLLSPIEGKTAGNDWLDKAVKQEVKFTDAPFVDGLQTIADMRDNGLIPKAMNALSREKATELFAIGKAAYFIEGAWTIAEFNKIMTDEELARTELNVLPAINGVAATSSAVGGTSYGINANLEGTKKADYAWEWVKFFNGFGDQQGVDIIIKGGIIPPVKDLQIPDSAPKLIKDLAKLQEGLEFTYVLDAVLKPTGMEYINTALQEIIAGDSTAMEIAEKYNKIAWD